MTHLHQKLASVVSAWRADGYACAEYPAVAEVLEWAHYVTGPTATADQVHKARSVLGNEAS